MTETDIDELIRRSGGPKVVDRPLHKTVRWKSLADTHAWKRRQPEMLGTAARAVGEIPS
jgi:hypothetical protein